MRVPSVGFSRATDTIVWSTRPVGGRLDFAGRRFGGR